jgi:hypothetical protein
MAVTLTDTGKKAILDAICTLLDAGSLVFTTAGAAVVATIALNADAFAAATGTGTVTANANTSPALLEDDAAGNASPITLCLLKTSGAVELLRMEVATSAKEVTLSNCTLAAHATLLITVMELHYAA